MSENNGSSNKSLHWSIIMTLLGVTGITVVALIVVSGGLIPPAFPTPTVVDINSALTFAILTITAVPTDISSNSTPEPISVEQQLAQIDQALKQSLKASIAYNVPTTMKLDEATTIELLLNPAIAPEALATQVTEGGQVVIGRVDITPQMKAVFKAVDSSLKCNFESGQKR